MRKLSYKLAAGLMAAMLTLTGVPYVGGLHDVGTVTAAENSDADAQDTHAFGYGDAETQLAPGVYTVPVKMINLSMATVDQDSTYDSFNRAQYSMAWKCIGNDGNVQVKVYQDGTASVTMDLQSVTFSRRPGEDPLTDMATNWIVYQDFDAYVNASSKGEAFVKEYGKNARVDETTPFSLKVDGETIEKDAPTRITYKVPDTNRNAVFVRMWIDAMQVNQDSAFVFDWKNAEREEGTQTESTCILDASDLEQGQTYIVPASLMKSNDIASPSAASAALGKYVEVTVDKNGTYQITADLYSVNMAGLVDYCQDIQYYDGTLPLTDSSKWKDVKVLATQEVQQSLGEGTKTVPTRIFFPMPKEMQNELEESDGTSGGVFIKMFVEAMNSSPSAYVSLDFANAKEKDDPTLTYKATGSSKVEQFGTYDVNATVSVENGKIADVNIRGDNWLGTHQETNKIMLDRAAAGMKENLTGKYDTDVDGIAGVDVVTGATYSSNAIREAVMNALDMEIPVEEIPEVTEEVKNGLEEGVYKVTIKNITDVVAHSLVGEETADAYVIVDEDGSMDLQYEMVSSTTKEPLQVLDFNGYYKNNDRSSSSNLTKESAVYRFGKEDTYGWDVVTDIRVPLAGEVSSQYYINTYLYVDAMSNLGKDEPEEIGGVLFDKGRFNIDSTITIYWDELEKVDSSSVDILPKEEDDKNPDSPSGQNGGQQGTTQTPTAQTPSANTGAQTSLTAGATYKAGKNTYQVTSDGTVTVKKVANKKSVKIPSAVTINGKKVKVTAIANNAFKKAKKLAKVTIGANVTTIGRKAFAGCKNLKKITVKSKKLTKVGKKAFKGINKKAVIKVPKKCRKAYTKLFKNKGQAKSVQIR